MKVLFDHGVPAPLRRRLTGHSIHTAGRQGWATLPNGRLLERADAEGYEVLVTTDQSMRYQQNLTGRSMGIVVLTATAWPEVRERVAEIQAAIDASRPGTLIEVQI